MRQYRLEPCWDRDSLWSWHCSRNSGYRFVCDDYRLHLHCNRQAFWQFGFIPAMVLPNWKLLSPEGKYALVLFSRLCFSLFLEAVASTNSIAVIDGSYIYGCALRTRVLSRGGVCLSFWRLWPLQIQLQWLTGVTLTNVRLNYITCNFFFLTVVSPLFLERNLLKRIILLQWQFDVSELFVADSCCSDSFVGKLRNFIHQFSFIPFWEKNFNLLECLPCWMTGDLFTWIHRLVTGSP